MKPHKHIIEEGLAIEPLNECMNDMIKINIDWVANDHREAVKNAKSMYNVTLNEMDNAE